MDFKKLKKELARTRRLFEARYNKSWNPISDLGKDQTKIYLIDPPQKIGAMICQNCGRIVSATLPHQCTSEN